MTLSNDPNVTDWITAIAAVFAAVGTVGAVAVALRQIARQERRVLTVHCSHAVIADVQNVHALALRATNDGFRPVKITGAHLQTDDNRHVFAHLTPHSSNLPVVLYDGESVEVFWPQEALEDVQQKEGFGHYLYAFFSDAAGNDYRAAYPGVAVKRKGLRRRLVYVP